MLVIIFLILICFIDYQIHLLLVFKYNFLLICFSSKTYYNTNKSRRGLNVKQIKFDQLAVNKMLSTIREFV